MSKSSGETKAQKFKRLAEKRTQAILDGIRKLANLANSNNYEYTQEQVEKIFGAIEERLRLARQRFEADRRLRGSNEKFTL